MLHVYKVSKNTFKEEFIKGTQPHLKTNGGPLSKLFAKND